LSDSSCGEATIPGGSGLQVVAAFPKPVEDFAVAGGEGHLEVGSRFRAGQVENSVDQSGSGFRRAGDRPLHGGRRGSMGGELRSRCETHFSTATLGCKVRSYSTARHPQVNVDIGKHPGTMRFVAKAPHAREEGVCQRPNQCMRCIGGADVSGRGHRGHTNLCLLRGCRPPCHRRAGGRDNT
jgi:hypothetical protein